ncbi:hypothetical protein TeGR_g7378 [Tetraparma gracilis]|uniref:Glutamine cyclotransferase n=1 Tax=Tetraparma gracilis TaxID=2962635 RepID=A0ABQ6MJE1_9STRA|nr:hypothetical protein TeGR_g7378 [Tetraparma gracilis]
MRVLLALLAASLLAALVHRSSPSGAAPSGLASAPPPRAWSGSTRRLSYSLLGSFPHDPSSFTQGLVYSPSTSRLYESAGLYGESSLRLIGTPGTPEQGRVLQETPVAAEYFAEGISLSPDAREVRMLTWKERAMLSFDAGTLARAAGEARGYRTHTGEGWGLTLLGGDYVASDGSDTLVTWDGGTMEEKGRVRVRTTDGKPVRYLNELEAYRGDVLANVWYSDVLLRIEPASGLVKAVYDFKDLWPRGERPQTADCFNGIALLEDDVLLVTGKLWDRYYTVQIEDPD